MPIYSNFYQTLTTACPIVELRGYAAACGLKGHLYAYLDFNGPTGTARDGLAEGMLALAIEKKKLNPGQPIIEAASGPFAAALEAKGWRLCRFLRRTELRASFTVETAQGTKIYEPVDCLWELTFPDGPIRHADGGWYDPASNAIETLRFVYGADGTTAFFEVMDDGQDKRFVFSADGREPAETMDFLRVEPVDA